MISRKKFLKQASLLSTVLLVAPACMTKTSEDSSENKTEEDLQDAIAMKVGLQLYSLREQIIHDVPGVIQKVAAAGYSEVETYGYSKQSLFWGLSPQDFNTLLKDNDLVSPSGHYDVGSLLGNATSNEEMFKGVDDFIEAAKEIGQKSIVVPWLAPELVTSIEDYKRIAEKLNTLGEYLQKAGLQLGYHNHDFEFHSFDGKTGYETFLNETDADKVKFELDLYWAVRSQVDPVKLFEDHPGRFNMWHAKDADKNDPTLNTEVGKGGIDFKSIFLQAKLAGLEHVYVEQENFAIDPYESIAESASYVKSSLLTEI